MDFLILITLLVVALALPAGALSPLRQVVLLVVALIAVTGRVWAQDTAVDVDPIVTAWKPYLDLFREYLLMAIAAFAGLLYKRWTGKQLEARHREALQSALRNGAELLMRKVPQGVKVNVGSKSVAEGIEYVLKSVPDALDFFGLTRERVAEMLEPHIAAIENRGTPVELVGEVKVPATKKK